MNWTDLLEGKDCETSFNQFHDILLKSIDKFAPEKNVKKKAKSVQAWISKSLLKCLRKQKFLYSKSISRNSTPQDRENYKEYKSLLQKVIRKTKRDYYSNRCLKFKLNTKKLWSTINEVVKKTANKCDIISQLDINGVISYDSNEIANEFGSFFANIGKTYADRTGKPNVPIANYNEKIKLNEKSLFLWPTNSAEVHRTLSNLKNKMSSGYDTITNKLLKILCDQICGPLSLIFNKSLSEGHFPSRMKSADVIPLFKAKGMLQKTNYRPISPLLTLSKVLKKIMYSRTYNFLESTHQIYEGQYGFHTKHSCENAIQNLIADIVKGDTKNKITKAVFLNLSKAFDTLSHEILLTKMERYGIRGKSLQWFKSYLYHRDMRVKCPTSDGDIAFSEPHLMEYGASQGSCLGPLLFTIFTNDLSRHLLFTKCILFAYNTTLYMSHNNENYLTWCIEEDLKLVNYWFKANLLTLNITKSVCMTFQSKRTTGHNRLTGCNISIENKPLPNVTKTKFLGVWIDNRLAWMDHLIILFTKIKQNANLLRHGRSFLNIHANKCLYYAQIYSHLTYGFLLWGNMISNTKRRINSSKFPQA